MIGWWVLFLAGIFLFFLGVNWYKANSKTSDGKFREMKSCDKLFWAAIMTPVGLLFITTFALVMRVPIIGHPVFMLAGPVLGLIFCAVHRPNGNRNIYNGS